MYYFRLLQFIQSGSGFGFFFLLIIHAQRGKLHFRPHGKIRRARKRSPFDIQQVFFIQRWPMGHIVCGGKVLTLKIILWPKW